MKFPSHFSVRIGLLALLVAGLLLAQALLFFSEHSRSLRVSGSVREARERGTFVREAHILPEGCEAGPIRFREAWIETETRVEYSWGFSRKYLPTGFYRLCLSLEDPKEQTGLQVYEGSANRVLEESPAKGTARVFSLPLLPAKVHVFSLRLRGTAPGDCCHALRLTFAPE